jgi:hypothetical protein
LIDGIERNPSDYLLLATVMRGAKLAADEAETRVRAALDSCSQHAAEKKNARNMAFEALAAHRRLVSSIVKFEPLIVRQAESEEQMVQTQPNTEFESA